MSTWIEANPQFLKRRELDVVIEALNGGGVVIVPSDSGYSLVCRLGEKGASQRIRQMRELDKHHLFTLLCTDLTHLAHYARVDNVQFRVLKTLFPGAFTCVLPASREVPRLVQHDKRKTIGLRVPDQAVLQSIIAANGEALMGVSLVDDEAPRIDLQDLPSSITNAVDVVVDIGELPLRPSTVLDLTTMPPEVIRQGEGDASEIVG